VGVAVDPNDGSIFVSDAWNRRIQKLDPTLAPVSEWPVPSWDSRAIFDKPYIAVASNGDVYVSDPQAFRLIAYNGAGEIKASINDFGTEMDRFGLPNGIAVDQAAGTLLVADAGNHRIMVLPLLP
jgi:DNA-binding beta-propeller fold protein YncE